MAEITVKIDGLDAVMRRTAKIEQNIRDKYSPLKVIAAKMWKEQIQHFEDEAGPDEPWVKSRRAERQNGKTLQDTGRLRQSIRFGNNDDSAWVGTNVDYAPHHQYGTMKMVQRMFLWMTEDFIEAQKEYLRQWVMQR